MNDAKDVWSDYNVSWTTSDWAMCCRSYCKVHYSLQVCFVVIATVTANCILLDIRSSACRYFLLVDIWAVMRDCMEDNRIIRTAFLCTVYHSCTQSYAQTLAAIYVLKDHSAECLYLHTFPIFLTFPYSNSHSHTVSNAIYCHFHSRQIFESNSSFLP